MSKKREKLGKLSIIFVDPPQISMTCQTKDFCLESFDQKNMHLLPPTPIFKISEEQKCYSCVPFYLMAIAKNQSNIPFKDCKIYGSFLNNIQGCGHFTSQSDMNIDPQKFYVFPYHGSINFTGKLTVVAYFNFKQENSNMKTKIQINETYEVSPSIEFLSLRYKRENFDSPPIFQYSIKNWYYLPIKSVKVDTSGNEKNKVCESLNPYETFSGYVLYKNPFTSVNVLFDVPFAHNCQWNEAVPDEAPVHIPPLQIEIKNIPRAIQALMPFNIKLQIKNLYQSPIQGTLSIKNSESIDLFGINNLSFPEIEPQKYVEVPLTLVALIQGKFHFPTISIQPINFSPIEVNFNRGIIVIGNSQ